MKIISKLKYFKIDVDQINQEVQEICVYNLLTASTDVRRKLELNYFFKIIMFNQTGIIMTNKKIKKKSP